MVGQVLIRIVCAGVNVCLCWCGRVCASVSVYLWMSKYVLVFCESEYMCV